MRQPREKTSSLWKLRLAPAMRVPHRPWLAPAGRRGKNDPPHQRKAPPRWTLWLRPRRALITNRRQDAPCVTRRWPIAGGHDHRKAGAARPEGWAVAVRIGVDTLGLWSWWHPRRARPPGLPKCFYCPASPPLPPEPRPAGICHSCCQRASEGPAQRQRAGGQPRRESDSASHTWAPRRRRCGGGRGTWVWDRIRPRGRGLGLDRAALGRPWPGQSGASVARGGTGSLECGDPPRWVESGLLRSFLFPSCLSH